jgi:transcriptional repressor NrdR
MIIVKKDGIREEFDRDKLASGLYKACEKRPMPTGTIQKLIDEIEDELYHLGKSEVDSSVVGEMVMERLRNLDHIAYIRFASVYRQFADIGSLKEEVDTLIESDSEKIRLPGQLPLIADDSKKVKRNSVSRFRRNYA